MISSFTTKRDECFTAKESRRSAMAAETVSKGINRILRETYLLIGCFIIQATECVPGSILASFTVSDFTGLCQRSFYTFKYDRCGRETFLTEQRQTAPPLWQFVTQWHTSKMCPCPSRVIRHGDFKEQEGATSLINSL